MIGVTLEINGRPPLMNRPPTRSDPTLIATSTVLTAIWSFSPRVPQGGAKPPDTLGATGEGLDSGRDSEGSYVLVWGRIW